MSYQLEHELFVFGIFCVAKSLCSWTLMSLHELLSFVDSRNVVFSTSHLCFMSWFLSSSVVCELGILSFSKLCGFIVELGILFLEG